MGFKQVERHLNMRMLRDIEKTHVFFIEGHFDFSVQSIVLVKETTGC